MIFGKLFGRHDNDDEEPAASPPVVRRPVPGAKPRPAAAAPRESEATPTLKLEGSPEDGRGGRNESKGFDPYNSGAFRKSQAWERINRR